MPRNVQEQIPEIESWDSLTITNRFIFNKVFTTNPDVCKKLLEILLGIKIARIEPPQGEYVIEGSIENRAVRFDVYTEDENHLYDIEMQTTKADDLPERARYYQSLMDMDSLQAGRPFKDLKDSIVIFICTFDPSDKKKPKYVFKNLDVSDSKTELNDRTTKIFFYVDAYDKITNNENLKGLLQYFSQNKSTTKFAGNLKKLVKIAKKNERWRQEFMEYERWKYYTEQEGVKKGIQQGAVQQKAEDEKIFMQKDAEIQRLKEELAKLKAPQAT